MKPAVLITALCCYQSAFAQDPATSAFSSQLNVLMDMTKASGDTAEHDSAVRALTTLEAQYQAADDWLLFGNLKAFRGRNGEVLTDNIQGISNIDAADRFSKIYEVYLQWQVGADTRLKCGQVDANLEFAFVPVAGSFISPPLGITPTAIALPTYYDPAMSCSAFYEPERGFQWMGGVFAGRNHLNFAEQFWVAEGRYVTDKSQLSYGYWSHNGDWNLLADENQTVAIDGWYLNYQHQLSDATTLFMVLSRLDDAVDALEEHRMLGVVTELPWQGQQLGMMVSQAALRHAPDEWLVETYWQYPISEQFFVQPVLQYIKHADSELNHSYLFTLRASLTF